MTLTLGSRLGEGGFADVYEATDKLGRRVAVKIVRASAVEISSALDHAKALARATHPNVVSVYTIDTVVDPETGEDTDGIVMELLEGTTLGKLLHQRRLATDELRKIGLGVIGGLRHIHGTGLAHGDIHSDNVIVVGSTPKIIDILYRDSLALLTTASKESRLRRDLTSTRLLLYEALLKSELDPADATDFNSALGSDASLDEMEAAFLEVLDPARADDVEIRVEQALARLLDEGYVEDDRYARALADDTTDEVCVPLVERIIEQGGIGIEHRSYLRLIWDRLDEAARNSIVKILEPKLTKETPTGRWGTPISLLVAFGRDCWNRLSQVAKLRLESVITNDVLAGYFDIYGANVGNPGTLGTYANTFWSYFQDRDRLIANLHVLLRGGWYSQNYVGKYFMQLLPVLADTPEREALIIEGVKAAVENDAKVIIHGLENLPPRWQAVVSPEDEDDDDFPF